MPPARKSPARQARRSARAGDEILIATETFSTDLDGRPVTVHKGHDRVRADHELAKRYPDFFEPDREFLSFEAPETATQRQGERRGDQD